MKNNFQNLIKLFIFPSNDIDERLRWLKYLNMQMKRQIYHGKTEISFPSKISYRHVNK